MSALMIDNWLLQDLGQCVTEGLSDDTATQIEINPERGTHSFKDVPMAGVQLEALLGFLCDVILRDSILVDQRFVDTWSKTSSAFLPVTKVGLLRTVDFLERRDDLNEPRKCM